MPELLTRYSRVRSPDIEEAREGIAEVLSPHRLDPLPHKTRGNTVFNVAALGAVRLCYLSYGVPVRVRAQQQPDRRYLLVVLPLAGRLIARSQRAEIAADGRVAALLDSDVDVDIHTEASAELMMVQLDLADLEKQLARMLGRPPVARLRLHAGLDVTTPATRSWLSTLGMVCRDLDGPRGLSHQRLQGPTEQLLMSQLLTAIPPTTNKDLAALATSTPRPATPRAVRRAEQLICDHAREALTVTDIAEAVGLSVRSLQEGFRRHLDTTPTARLLQARLTGVRADLHAADPRFDNVAQLAHDWGFAHLGRFARAYRQTFGESPSDTLRR